MNVEHLTLDAPLSQSLWEAFTSRFPHLQQVALPGLIQISARPLVQLKDGQIARHSEAQLWLDRARFEKPPAPSAPPVPDDFDLFAAIPPLIEEQLPPPISVQMPPSVIMVNGRLKEGTDEIDATNGLLRPGEYTRKHRGRIHMDRHQACIEKYRLWVDACLGRNEDTGCIIWDGPWLRDFRIELNEGEDRENMNIAQLVWELRHSAREAYGKEFVYKTCKVDKCVDVRHIRPVKRGTLREELDKEGR